MPQAARQLCAVPPLVPYQDPVSKDGFDSMATQTQGALPCAQGYPPRHQTGSPLPPGYGYPAPPPAPALQNGVHRGFAAFDSPAAVAAGAASIRRREPLLGRSGPY